MSKSALITGINGQDGSYLAELLLERGYIVYGILKRNSVAENQTARLDDIYWVIKDNLFYADMLDMASLVGVLQKCEPDEIYNLAAQSHVRISFDQPIYTLQTVAVGTLNLLEAIKLTCPKAKMYQASSSEMFGNSIDDDGFQRETTPMIPTSPYGCAKVYGYNIVRNYRSSYNLFVSNGILFNHESPRRGTNFVTNKVVKTAVEIARGMKEELKLGNLLFIPTQVNWFGLSMVVQKTNYQEIPHLIKLRQKLIDSTGNKNIYLYFSKITDWKTYSKETYEELAVWKSNHTEHKKFLKILNENINKNDWQDRFIGTNMTELLT